MHRNLIVRTLILGFVTGLRMMTGIAALGLRANRAPRGFRGTPFGWLAYPKVAATLGVLAGIELFNDKLPILPSRTAPIPLLGRAQVGALVGAATFTEADAPGWQGALIGAACAVAGSFAGYNYRVRVASALNVPDFPVALIEDAATAALAAAALKTYD